MKSPYKTISHHIIGRANYIYVDNRPDRRAQIQWSYKNRRKFKNGKKGIGVWIIKYKHK